MQNIIRLHADLVMKVGANIICLDLIFVALLLKNQLISDVRILEYTWNKLEDGDKEG